MSCLRKGQPTGFEVYLLGFVLLVFMAAEGKRLLATPAQTTPACKVTEPNGIVAGEEPPDPGSHGNWQLSVGPFGLWPGGTVVFEPGGAGFVTQDGALGMKFGWRRGVRGQLRIEGRRLHARASPLRAEVPNGYGDFGFQASYVIFPTAGCWEVTGRVGNASLTFVTMVAKSGDGPAWRRDSAQHQCADP